MAHVLACWIPKATSAHSEYVTLIVFPLQQWLKESVLMLRLRTLPVLCYYSIGNSKEINFEISQTFRGWATYSLTQRSPLTNVPIPSDKWRPRH